MAVSILILSHSKKLAEGLKEIIDQMVRGSVRVEALGGEEVLGASPAAIRDAMLRLSAAGHVAVFGDFGSTIMGAKAAIKTLPSDVAKKVLLVDAPLVEGAFAAAVEASTGASIEEVKRRAEEARSFRKI